MIDNSDLRLLNLSKKDELYYRHKFFIATWQKANSVSDVCKKLHIPRNTASNRANAMRKAGIALKRFHLPGPKENLAVLRKVALASMPKTKPTIDSVAFVKYWNTKAKSVKDVAAHFKTPYFRIQSRAGKLRAMGIPLRYFIKHTYRLDIQALKKAAGQ